MSFETTLQTNDEDLSFVLCANKSVQTNKSQPLPRLHQISEQSKDSSPSAVLFASTPSLLQETRRSDSSQAYGAEISSCIHLPTTETNLGSTEEQGLTHSPASHPCLELPVSAPGLSSFRRVVAVGLSEPAAGLSEGSTRSVTDHESSLPAVGERQVSLGAEGKAPPSAALTDNTSVISSVTQVNLALPSVPASKEKEDSLQISPDTLFENLPNTLSEVAKPLSPQSEHDVERLLIPSIVFLSGVISLSVALQEPRALFFIGLFLVLLRL
ncbi:hypothetical protein LDENG_00227880 [Lucifuga dentata]|nr:hypothetical protein LDENG_00227880 [Lucifuga dentata]